MPGLIVNLLTFGSSKTFFLIFIFYFNAYNLEFYLNFLFVLVQISCLHQTIYTTFYVQMW